MKESKLCKIYCILCAILFVLTCAQYSRVLLNWGDGDPIGWDGRTRRNEIRLAHQGVNSFHVWNHAVSVPGFRPLERPDMDDLPGQSTDLLVHAYPAWQACFFWFVGEMGDNIYLPIMYCLFGACLSLVVSRIHTLFSDFGGSALWLTMGTMALLAHPISVSFFSLNYSMLILAACFLLLGALDDGRQFWGGICWALMMIKPQMAVLFFWPLFCRKQYKAIVIAVVTCLGATVAMSIVYHESPVQLILQIPKIGAPYTARDSSLLLSKFCCLFGGTAQWVWSGFFFMLCGWLCYMLRKQPVLECCVPVAVLVPLWSYSQPCDHVVLAIWYVVVFHLVFFEGVKRRFLWVSYAVTILISGFARSGIWVFGNHCGFFDPEKAKCIIRGFDSAMCLITIAMVIGFALSRRKRGALDLCAVT